MKHAFITYDDLAERAATDFPNEGEMPDSSGPDRSDLHSGAQNHMPQDGDSETDLEDESDLGIGEGREVPMVESSGTLSCMKVRRRCCTLVQESPPSRQGWFCSICVVPMALRTCSL